ncbi:FGGY-family carbohydrate kinase [Agromyces sp. G08B096]|uniref:FGGY-family carbohydrate kinase n=1 Tax=Agromyces sp. G08B096 TaxID=3156399 RepID=A0AAU7W793_9MICO
MTHDPLWVGVDLGTQSVKAAVVDDRGDVAGRADAPLRSRRVDGLHEQDPALWRTAAARAVAAVIAPLAPAARERIGGISLCSTSGSVVLADAAGIPATPGVMYDDLRGASAAGEVAAAAPALWARLGYSPQPSWPICTLAWWASHGDLRDRRLVLQGDVVAAAICGHPVPTDWTSALKLGYDTHELRWDDDLLEHLGVRRDILPDVVAPGTTIGVVGADWARETGIPAGVPVFAGLTDGCAAQLASGALDAGAWHTVLGTTLVFKGVSAKPVSGGDGAVYAHRSPDGLTWLPGGASNTGAGMLAEVVSSDRDLAPLEAGAEALDPVTVPLSYPLTGVGERFPVVAPTARGFVLTADGTAPLDSLRALGPAGLLSAFAGVAFVERLGLEVLAADAASAVRTVSTSGGGTRSRLWNRVRASVLGVPLAITAADGAVGAAMLAAWGARSGSERLAEVAARLSRPSTVVDPEPAWVRGLDDHYARFTEALIRFGWLEART